MGGGGDSHPDVDEVLPILVLSLVTGVVVDSVLRHALPKWFALPFTVVMGMMGALWGVLEERVDLGMLGNSIRRWENLHPHSILFLMLPPLIFESAFNLVRRAAAHCVHCEGGAVCVS